MPSQNEISAKDPKDTGTVVKVTMLPAMEPVIASLPDLPLHGSSEFSEWRNQVRQICSRAGLVQNLDKDCTGTVDAMLQTWLLQQIPNRTVWARLFRSAPNSSKMESLLFGSKSSYSLWTAIETCAKYLSVCTYIELADRSFHFTEVAASQGCEECLFMLRFLQNLGSRLLRPDQGAEKRRIRFLVTDTSVMLYTEGASFGRHETYHLQEIDESKLGHIPHISLLGRSVIYEASSFLRECVSKHTNCEMADNECTPRRLIDVGGHKKTPCLTTSMPQGCPYAALSYCSDATGNTFVTNKRNIDQHCDSIEFDTLPKTISDAITVCRYLQIPYLWVKDLCIVQDDVNEQEEYERSSKIGFIYSDAYVVISAETASSCTEGFLPRFSQEGHWNRLYQPPRGNDLPDNQKLIWKRFGGSTRTSALGMRSWAAQENTLSRRTLHFAENEVIWECNSACMCECDNPGDHELWKHPDIALLRSTIGKPANDETANANVIDFLRGSTPDSIYWAWERVVEQYSLRTLNKSSDKLPALSGMAKRYRSKLNVEPDNYLAGLWRENLLVGLLWYVTGSVTPMRPLNWRAPSWSWTSLDGSVGFFHERYQFSFHPNVQILEAVCTPKSSEPFGTVQQGWIKLRGVVEPVELMVTKHGIDSPPYKGQYTGYNGGAPRAHSDLLVQARFNEDRVLEVLPDLKMSEGNHKNEYYCLHIGRMAGGGQGGERNSWLLLRKRKRSSRHEYGEDVESFERVGIGMLDSSKAYADLFPEIVDGGLVRGMVLV